MTARYSSGHLSQPESSGGSAASRFRLRFEAHQAVFPLVVAVSERSIESPAALKLASFVPAQAEKQHCSRKGYAYNGGAHTSANVSGIDHTTYYAGARERLSVPGPLQPDPGRRETASFSGFEVKHTLPLVGNKSGGMTMSGVGAPSTAANSVAASVRREGARRRCPVSSRAWQATPRGSARLYAARVCG
jgi:hypothetical protein